MCSYISENYRKQIWELRHSKKLHTAVEDKLITLIKKISTEYYPIKEPVGLAGGRNDLMLFEFSGRKVLFEIFASRNQVSRDLRILDKTDADKKIAIIIDKEVDNKVFDAFIRENPEDNYPFLFVSELFNEPLCLFKLRELILGDEEAKFQRMLRTKLPIDYFLKTCKKEGIRVFSKEDIKTGNINFTNIFITIILGKCLKYGISREKVKTLGQWLSKKDTISFILNKIYIGMNVILYTDFIENFAILDDVELSDWIRACYLFPHPFFNMSLNAIIAEINEKYLNDRDKLFTRKEPSIYLGLSQVFENSEGNMVVFSLPNNTNSIIIIPPMINPKQSNEYLKMVQVTPPETLVAIKLSSSE